MEDYKDGFQEGAEYVLRYLAEFFGGLEDRAGWSVIFSETK